MSEAEDFEFRLRMEQEAAASIDQVASAEPPSALAVAGNAAAKGAAGFGDMFLNAPSNLLNVGKFVAGDTMEKLGHPIWDDIEVTPQPNLIDKGMRAAGFIRPENEPQTAGQRILDRAVQTGVAVAASPAAGVSSALRNVGVGLASGAAAGVTKEATGSDLAALAVGVAVPMAAGLAFRSKANAPILKNPVKLETAKEGMAAGLVVPPSHLKPSFTTNKLESVAGKAATLQDVQMKNVEGVNNLARKALDLPEGTPLTEGTIEQIREQAGKVYDKLRTLVPGRELRGMKVRTVEDRPTLPGPATGMRVKEVRGEAPNIFGLNAQEIRDESGNLLGMRVGTSSKAAQGPLESVKTTVTSRGENVPGPLGRLRMKVKEFRGGSPVDELKQARADAKVFYRHNSISGDPASLTKANALTKRAMEIEDQLEQAAVSSGNPQLITEFREARTLIAKTHAVERALNVGDGTVDARVIGRLLDQGQPLTGELKIIGKFANAFPNAVRAVSKIQSPGVSGTEAGMSAMLGAVGYGAAGGPAGLLAAGLPLLRSPARALLLSKGYQNRLLKEAPGLNQAMMKSILAGRAVADSP